MTNVKRIFVLPLAAIALLGAFIFSQAEAQDTPISASEKEKIEKVVREFILGNPDVIVQAMKTHENDQRAEQQRQMKKAVQPLLAHRKNDHVYGDPDAPLTLIEYSDFECSYCKRFHPSAKALVDESDGQINWIYRHLPLPMHAGAMPKALAAECASAQGGGEAFWTFVDAFFESNVPVSGLRKLAEDTGLNGEEFQACLDSQKYKSRVQQNITEASGADIRGTPFNILVNNETQEVAIVPGAFPLSALKTEAKKLR